MHRSDELGDLGIGREEALASRFEAACDALPVLFWQTSQEGMLEAGSIRLLEFIGARTGESGGLLPPACVSGDDLHRLGRWWEALNQTMLGGEIELRLLSKGGAARWFRVIVAPWHRPQGQLYWICIGIDIDEQKQAEALMGQRAEEFRTIADAISQYVVVLDPDGTVIFVNKVVTEQTGMSLSEVGGEQNAFTRPFHPEDSDRVRLKRSQGLERGIAFQLEVRVQVLGGRYRWFLMQYKPLKDKNGQVLRWYVTGTDIHEQREQRDTLQKENFALREELQSAESPDEMTGRSAAMIGLRKQLSKVAKLDTTVLILGETGTGKELVARALHRQSNRRSRPFIRVNCAAIPQSLISSELFGHEKGAFTGATQRRQGKFEAAEGGTLFLDEVGDLPMETQIALLRVLQEREIERIGSNSPVAVDIRLVAATHRNLLDAIEAGSFREDLFYRLNVLPITMPPLRERPDDIPVLVEHFVAHFGQKFGRRIRHVERDTLSRLHGYRWPGNVRELQNVIERAVILSDTDTLFFDQSWLNRDESTARPQMGNDLQELARHEKAIIKSALAEARGRISGPSGAAARLGIPRQTLESKMKKLGISRA